MGHAIYIGRVGALAVALGVGVAVATGYGIGNPAVAWAEDGTGSAANAPNTADDSAADAPSSDPSGPADTVINTAVPQTNPDSAPGPSPATGAGPAVPEMNFSNTGGAQLSGLDEDSDLGEDAEQDATTPTPIVHAPETPVTQAETPPPAAATDTAVVTPAPPTDDLLAPSGANTRTLTQDPTGLIDQDSDANAGQFSGGQPGARTMSTLTLDNPAAPQMFTAAAGPLTPAPTPLTAQSTNLLDALSGAPAVLANIAITAINTLLTSIFSPGPATPAPPMMLFIVLGWVQRELQRSSFNQSPTAVVDTITTSEDTGVNIAVLANDIDADVSAPVAGLPGGDVLTVTDYTQPAHGSVVLNEDRTFTYTPNANYTGTDTFNYTVSDEASPWHVHGLGGLISGGGHISTTTATITITPVDDTPVAVNDGPISVAEDSGPTLIQVLANDTDPDAGPIKVQSVTDPASGSVTFTDATVTYTPDANFNGTDTFTYTLNGESTATVTVTVTAVDDAPVANPDFYSTYEDNAYIIDALYNDTDVDAGPKEVAAVTQPTNGTAAIIDGVAIIYTPDANFNGTDTFSYTVNGGSTATVTFTVIAVDDNPVAVNDTATITEDSPAATIDVLANDTDPDAGPKQITAVTQPTSGTVTFTDTTLTYTPNPNAFTTTAPDTFTYTLNGGSTATVAVTITAVNDGPVAPNQSLSTPVNTSVLFDVLAGVTDVDGGQIYLGSIPQWPANGTLYPPPVRGISTPTFRTRISPGKTPSSTESRTPMDKEAPSPSPSPSSLPTIRRSR